VCRRHATGATAGLNSRCIDRPSEEFRASSDYHVPGDILPSPASSAERGCGFTRFDPKSVSRFKDAQVLPIPVVHELGELRGDRTLRWLERGGAGLSLPCHREKLIFGRIGCDQTFYPLRDNFCENPLFYVGQCRLVSAQGQDIPSCVCKQRSKGRTAARPIA